MAIDMGYWAKLEARIQEVAHVTPVKAPELLATFNRAALDLDRLANLLELEQQLAVREAERIRGEILLDRVPAILKEKGVASSQDMREAVLSQDQEYQDALDRADMLKAMTKMIKGKYDAFERAFRSVRTLVGEATFNFGNSSKELGHGTSEAKPVGIGTTRPGFGTAKIGG